MNDQHDPEILIDVFNDLFTLKYQTRLLRGAGEPQYLPADETCRFARVEFAHGFFASALHEVSHWCLAGEQRRLLIDYGYWYKPDGRTVEEQRSFEMVEVKPQALEWIFSVASGSVFHFSADNLSGRPSKDWELFQINVAAEARRYVSDGLPRRARCLVEALAARFATGDAWRKLATFTSPSHLDDSN